MIGSIKRCPPACVRLLILPMPVLKLRFCPACQIRTYQYYRTPYQSKFICAAHWECAECGVLLDSCGQTLAHVKPAFRKDRAS